MHMFMGLVAYMVNVMVAFLFASRREGDATGIIYPIDQLKWARPMVFQLKKHDPTKLWICVDFRELNKVTLIDPFPTPFADEILKEFVGHEC